VGGIVLGVGIGTALLGLAITENNIGGLFVVTAGVLGILGGLITLLVGAIMKAAE
jgi:hypothetical protein